MQEGAVRVREPHHILVPEVACGDPTLRKEGDTNYLKGEVQMYRLKPFYSPLGNMEEELV